MTVGYIMRQKLTRNFHISRKDSGLLPSLRLLVLFEYWCLPGIEKLLVDGQNL